MSVALLGDINSFNKGMDKAGTKMQAFASKVGAAGTKIANAGKAMSLAITLPLVGFGIAAVKFAADAEEIQSKFDAVFKEFAEQTTVWINDFADAVNRNATDLKEYASVFQDTFVPLGFARGEAAELSQSLVELTIDLASFNNASEPETMRALQSAIVGNHETVRKFGVIITQATLNIELMNMGIKDGVKAATEAEKAQARLNLIIAGTSDAQGDAVRTAESFTNQMKGLKGELKEIGEDIGKIIIPYVLQLVEKIKELTKAWSELSDAEKEKIVKLLVVLAAAGPVAILVGSLAKAIGALTLATKALTASAAAKAILSTLSHFAVALALAGAEATALLSPLIITAKLGDDLADALKGDVEAGRDLGTTLQGLEGDVTAMDKAFNGAINGIGALANQFVEFGPMSITALGEMMDELGTVKEAVIQQVVDGVPVEEAAWRWGLMVRGILDKYAGTVPGLEAIYDEYLESGMTTLDLLAKAHEEEAETVVAASETIETAVAKVARGVERAKDVVLGLDKVLTTLDIDAATDNFTDLATQLNYTKEGSLDYINVINDMQKAYETLVKAEEDIVKQGGKVDDELQELIASYEEYVSIVEDADDATETFSDALADLAKSGAYTAKQALDSVVGAVENAYSTFFDAWAAMKETNETAMEDYKELLQDLADAEGESIKDAADRRATALRELSDDLEDDKITRERYGRDKAQIEADYAKAVEDAAQRRKAAGESEEYAYRQQQVGIHDILGDMLDDFLRAARAHLLLEAAKETTISVASGFALNFTAATAHGLAAVRYLLGAGALAIAGFAQGGVVPGPPGAPVMAVVHGGEEIRTPAQQMVDYEMMGQAVQAGTYEAMVEVMSKDAGRPIVVQLGDGTRLAQALYNPLAAELARRGG